MACLQQHLGRARSRKTSSGEVQSVSCGIWWHEDDYAAAVSMLGPLPIVPANDGERRKAADLCEVYQFIFNTASCRHRSIVLGAFPDEDSVDIEPCGCCDVCSRKSGSTRVYKKHIALTEGFKQAEQRYGKDKVRQIDLVATIMEMEPRSTSEAAVSHLVFAALRLQVLREDKWGAGTTKRIVRGEKFDALGDTIFCGYHDKAAAKDMADESDSDSDVATNRPRSYSLLDSSEEDEEESDDETADDQIQAFRSPPSRIRVSYADWSELVSPHAICSCL